MSQKLTPEDLYDGSKFELLAEVSHQSLREFIVEQITKEKVIIRIYSVYQVSMITLFAFLFTRGIVLFIKGNYDPLIQIGLSILFSVTILIIIHELLHALAYLATGARKISFGAIPKKLVVYAMANRQVIAPRAFHVVALTPFVVVKLACIAGVIWFAHQPLTYFFLSTMCLHSLFCAGDIAMLAFYRIHKGKEIYNFDDKSEGKTYFYNRIKKGKSEK
jgi:hypothetical protein